MVLAGASYFDPYSKSTNISCRWIQHILTDDKKRIRLQTAKPLLKMFPKFNQRQFANIVMVTKHGFTNFDPERKVGMKILLTKQGRRPVDAKGTMSTKIV